MALFELVPPAVDLVADHCRFIDEEGKARDEQMRSVRSAPATGAKNSQPGKTLTPPAAAGFVGQIGIVVGFDALVARRALTAARRGSVTGVSVSGRSGVSSSAGCGALGFGVEFADGFDFVAEELDADGTIGFGRVDVEDAAAARELAGHLDESICGVADAGEVRE